MIQFDKKSLRKEVRTRKKQFFTEEEIKSLYKNVRQYIKYHTKKQENENKK